MKPFLTLLTTLILSLDGHAKTPSSSDLKQIFRGTSIANMFNTPSAQPPIAPIREAKGKVRITRITYIKNGTQIDSKVDEVCQKDIVVDVFDMRKDPFGNFQPQVTVCSSDIQGQAVDVAINPWIQLTTTVLFLNEPASDFKVFVATLGVSSAAATPADGAYFLTKNLIEKSAVAIIAPYPQVTCEVTNLNGTYDCNTTYPVAFNATVEFMD